MKMISLLRNMSDCLSNYGLRISHLSLSLWTPGKVIYYLSIEYFINISLLNIGQKSRPEVEWHGKLITDCVSIWEAAYNWWFLLHLSKPWVITELMFWCINLSIYISWSSGYWVRIIASWLQSSSGQWNQDWSS